MTYDIILIGYVVGAAVYDTLMMRRLRKEYPDYPTLTSSPMVAIVALFWPIWLAIDCVRWLADAAARNVR